MGSHDVAIVALPSASGGRSIVCRRSLASAEGSRPLPWLRDVLYTRLPGSSLDETLSEVPARLRRGLSRAARRAQRTVAFFTSSKLSMGRGVLTEMSGTGDRATHTSYVEVSLPQGRQWIHVRQPFALRPRIGDYRRVTVVSGSCLFSAPAVRFVLEGGGRGPSLLSPLAGRLERPVRDIRVDDGLTLYEYELEARLTRAIADVVALVPSSSDVRVVLDVPRVQYYFHLLDAFAKGLVPRALVLRWFDLVDDRRDLVIERLRRGLADRGLDHGGALCTATILDPLAEQIRAEVIAGGAPKVSTLAEAPALMESRLWRVLLRVSPPREFDDLSHLSYAAEVLKAGAHRAGHADALGLVVDSPLEHKILSRARKLGKALVRSDPEIEVSLLGLYVQERLMLARDGRRAALYLCDPGRRLKDEQGVPVDGFELVDELYGGPVGGNFESLDGSCEGDGRSRSKCEAWPARA